LQQGLNEYEAKVAKAVAKFPERKNFEAQRLYTPLDIEDFDYVFGGFFEILKNNEEVEFSYSSRNSRTAAGISSDGKTLFLLVVEGERKNLSRGLSYGECAKILKSAGSADGLEFDGGSSSSLFVDGKNVLLYRNFRKCAAFFGFCTSGK